MQDIKVSLIEMVSSLSNVIDMISPFLSGHHIRVSFISQKIAKHIGLAVEEQNDIMMAALLHDCGALSLQDKLEALNFEVENPRKHSEIGYRLLKDFPYFKKMAEIIRYHHISCKGEEENGSPERRVPYGSYVLHLADRVDVLIDRKKDAPSQADMIRKIIAKESGRMFLPELVEAFLYLSEKPSFWKELDHVTVKMLGNGCFRDILLDFENVQKLTKIFERIVDFRSRFTATHSSGVAAVAEALARCMDLPEKKCNMIRIAGYLHDIGKLAVPIEILEKRDRLTREEFEIVKLHATFSYQMLKRIKGFETINEFASYHHERLNGTGYPFGLNEKQLGIEARIIGVADIFTAVTENRPYRKGMDSSTALGILQRMADSMEIDGGVVRTLMENHDKINTLRIKAQADAVKEYEEFLDGVELLQKVS